MKPGGTLIGEIFHLMIQSYVVFKTEQEYVIHFFSISKDKNSRTILVHFLSRGPMDPKTWSQETVYCSKMTRYNQILFSANESRQNFRKSHGSVLKNIQR